MFDLNNFVIDRVIRGLMVNSGDGSLMWSINQITEPTLSITAETSEAVDAIGSPIAIFNRAKRAEFSAQNSLFDLSLCAAQNGTEKQVASEEKKIDVPAFETLVVPATTTEPVALKHTPKVTPTVIYKLNGDGTLGASLEYSASAGVGKFTYDDGAHTITFPTDAVSGDQYFIYYDYEATEAVVVEGNGKDFPKAGRFIMEVLGADVCDQSNLVHAYIIFPNAKLDANVDMTFTTDGTHPFTIQAQQDYCDHEKRLFQIAVPNEE